MSNAMKERLVQEASLLSSKQHMASLIIDEASIKQKCIYDRKADAVFGLKDKPESSMTNPPNEALANRVLCFVLHGTTSRYKIPCSYYFTKQLRGRDLFAWTKEVIAAVESCGLIIVRTVTDNYSANVTMFKLMGNGSLNTVVRHPHDTSRVIFLSFDPCHVLKNVTVFVIGLALLVCVSAGGIGLGYGGYGAGYGGGGLGVGSSVVLLRGGPGFAKAVAGPTFLVSTVHHVNKLHGGGAIVAHSGLGGYGAGYGLGYGGYGIKG
ncbi:hypothetical protein HPB50_017489 [Hyalomma asiaticum]|uniref:Uncharacterized protein n=1 Tax=Hyalomma asiaticum TaxID=266040 RepID=A0ACB7SHX2_HYAAI|nr:hypothetical protein HPB50_017489 [Hyalomma asiaticum]